jgi:hypothetical protein
VKPTSGPRRSSWPEKSSASSRRGTARARAGWSRACARERPA